MSRSVTAREAPELWDAVGQAARRLHTAPPDNIVIGTALNFYVTELSVRQGADTVSGRTLYLSHPLLKQLSAEEVLAVIGHELGHFIGDDTRMTRDFYPMRFKASATMATLAQSGVACWASFHFLNFFTLCFAETEQRASRSRELLADQKAAELTSPQTAARALVRLSVMAEAFNLGVEAALHNPALDPFSQDLKAVVRERLVPNAEFWNKIFEKELPHPLDSHPPLHVRLEALGAKPSVEEARALALEDAPSAYTQWLSNRDELFTDLTRLVSENIGKMRSAAQVREADYGTAAGKELLDHHFPEIRWPPRQGEVWFTAIFLLFVGAGLAAGAWFAPPLFAKLGLGGGALFCAFLGIHLLRCHRDAQFVLSANGITYSRWNRPLKFSEVERISGRSAYSAITLTFHLKTRQPSYSKIGLPAFRSKAVSFTLSRLKGKQPEIAQTILNYFTRQEQ